MSLHPTLQGNERKTKSPARHREAHRSWLVRLGCEVMEDRVLLGARAPRLPLHSPRPCRRDYSANPWNAGVYTTYNNHTVFGGVFSCNYAFLKTNYYYADSGTV